jgi:hypothetical protein
MAAEKLFEIWAKRNPEWNTRYEDSIIKTFSDYGKGTTSYQDVRGKLFGAGYEIFIVAFFFGLYFNQTKPLPFDKAKRKVFGRAIQYWGNQEHRNRKSYNKIREYIFMSLVAKSDVDFIALEKGDITPRKAVDILIEKMEEYANFGFYFMEEKLTDNPNFFYNETAFLTQFMSFVGNNDNVKEEDSDDEPESLD